MSRCKVRGNFYNHFNIKTSDGMERNIDLEMVNWEHTTEEAMMVMVPREKHHEEQCKEAKRVELKKLEEWGEYREVEDIGQFRISSTWVLWMKQGQEGSEEVRARLVARGFEEQNEVPSDSPTIDKANIRILLALCVANKWVLQTSDVKSAFLQGRKLERLVTMKPPREAKVQKGYLCQLEVALYGLDDASLQFYLKCKDIFLELGCTQSKLDPALFFKMDDKGKLEGVLATHVDDFLHAGNKKFQEEVSDKLANIFVMGKTESFKFKYVGFEIEQDEETKEIKMSQEEFAEKVETLTIPPERMLQKSDTLTLNEQTDLRKTAGKVGWLGRGTRPDLMFSQVEMSTRFLSGKVEDLIQASKAIRRVKSRNSFLLFKNLGQIDGWIIEVYTDTSHRNLNEGVNSTGAVMVLLRNDENVAVPIFWCTNKIKRVCGSTLEAETLALVEGMGHAVYVGEVIRELCGLRDDSIPIKAFVDNKGTYEAVHSTVAVDNKRLRGDMARVKEFLNTNEVTCLTWVPGSEQMADGLTKRTASNYKLLQVFQTGQM